ncbi:unnamed protein product [Linum trigynum]|uniref:C2H2-type domain-containing protein n=1 Tax=Linum trigynum TaxID=586398 RepID=A0AAV2EQC9_9ROSI
MNNNDALNCCVVTINPAAAGYGVYEQFKVRRVGCWQSNECAICGEEFTSGQALGGHMRRHRASNAENQTATGVVTATAAGIVDTSAAVNYEDLNNQQKNHVLSLDLNLPAPEDLDSHQHHRAEQSPSKFQFASKQSTKAMMFSAPALVGCHY